MTEPRQPIATLEALDQLNDEEVVEGYFDGRKDEPEPGNNRSLSYWHGWRNGRVDGGHAESDDAQRELARAVIDSGRLKKLALPRLD